MHSPDKRLYITFVPHGSSISSPKSSSQHFQLCSFISKNEYKAPTWGFHSRLYTAEWLIPGWHLIPKAFMFLLTIMCSVPCRLPRDLNILKRKCSHAARMWSECPADIYQKGRLLAKAVGFCFFLCVTHLNWSQSTWFYAYSNSDTQEKTKRIKGSVGLSFAMQNCPYQDSLCYWLCFNF